MKGGDMMDLSDFYGTLADIVDTNVTHVLSFELRKLNPEQRVELQMDLRRRAKELRARQNTQVT